MIKLQLNSMFLSIDAMFIQTIVLGNAVFGSLTDDKLLAKDAVCTGDSFTSLVMMFANRSTALSNS